MNEFLSILRSRPASVKTVRSVGSDPNRIAPPSHRHAAPSAPWPWVDIGDDVDREQLASKEPPIPELCPHHDCSCWTGYPQSRFPNWTERQVRKSKIWDAVHKYRRDLECKIFRCDVNANGYFTDAGPLDAPEGKDAETWKTILHETNHRPSDLRVRALFLQNMSGPVLKMLGARFNIDPFYFSSSLNWIPSRFQEQIQEDVGDNITVALTFIKSVEQDEYEQEYLPAMPGGSIASRKETYLGSQRIDTQAPLVLHSNHKVLSLDLLSVHLIRHINGSTIISYHPTRNLPVTSAEDLHERIRFAGRSVYWQGMFQQSPDPTLVLLCFVWHAIYGWDGAIESLYEHVLALEFRSVSRKEIPLARELHTLRAHHLNYSTLLDDLIETIGFIQETPNPFMTEVNFKSRLQTLADNEKLIARECKILLKKVDNMKSRLTMNQRRLESLEIIFVTLTISNTQEMRKLAEASVRDSSAMRQISFLTMIFLPAGFIASIFGMNVAEINPGSLETLPRYVATAIPFTIATIWVTIAFQSKYMFGTDMSFWWRLTWPFQLFYEKYIRKQRKAPTDNTFADVEEEKEITFNIGREGSLRDVEVLPTTHARPFETHH